MTRPLTRRFAAPSPRFAGRGISREVLLPACGEKVCATGKIVYTKPGTSFTGIRGRDRMPWSRGPVDDRIEFMRLYETGRYSVSELCTMKGVSRACGHKWIKRWREAGIAGLEERSRAPHEHGNRTDAKWVEILLRLKHEHPSQGPAKLVEMMADREGNRPIAASTAGEILNRYGLVRHRRPERQPIHRASEMTRGATRRASS